MKRLVFILSIFASSVGFAQETSDCSKNLKKAQQSYDKGNIDNLKSAIGACMENGFNRAEKTEAYILFILSSLFNDDVSEAEKNMELLLKENPDYKPKPSDHQEIKNLYKKYRTKPLVIVDFGGGINFSEARLLEDYSLDHNEPVAAQYYSKLGVNAGVSAHYLLKDTWRLSVGTYFKTMNYGISEYYNRENSSDSIYQTIDSEVALSTLEFPFGVSKEIGSGKLMPHFGLGFTPGINLSSFTTIRRDYQNPELPVQNATGTPVATLQQTSFVNASAYLNAGLRFKIGLTGKVFLDTRFQYGLINQTNSSNRYSNPTLIYRYYFVPDNYLLHNMVVSVGYSQLIYKPKKLNK